MEGAKALTAQKCAGCSKCKTPSRHSTAAKPQPKTAKRDAGTQTDGVPWTNWHSIDCEFFHKSAGSPGWGLPKLVISEEQIKTSSFFEVD